MWVLEFYLICPIAGSLIVVVQSNFAVSIQRCDWIVRRSILYGLSPYDPAAFMAASAAWLMVAMLASWLPARRATRVDPLTALKYD